MREVNSLNYTQVIREYIRHQEGEDRRVDQMQLM
jgi:hypothetical protein